MAEVLPFTGLRYNAQKTPDLASVLTPPYDIISPDMQEAYYARHPNNLVRVDYGKGLASDNDLDNRYTRAATMLGEWRQQGLLELDEKRTYTAYEQTFTLPDGSKRSRLGIFAAVRLEDFGKGAIHAHEQTFEGPKSDRFKLLRATACNTSPVFCIYSDPAKKVDNLIKAEMQKKPQSDFTTDDGIRNRSWTISAEKLCREITEAFAGQDLYIADGHHRYETALHFRDRMREQFGHDATPQPYDYLMMYLCNAENEGMTILPTHRALAREMDDGVNPEEFLQDLDELFRIKPEKLNIEDDAAIKAFADKVEEAGEKRPSFGIVLKGGVAAIASLRGGIKRSEIMERKVPKEIRALDVTLLHELILRQTWVGNPEVEFDDHDILYSRDAVQAVDMLRKRKACAVFLMNAPTLEQMMDVARAGRRMPQKSTYFYPKVITGLVMRPMELP